MGLLCIFLPNAKKIKNLNTHTGDKYSNLVQKIVGGDSWSALNKNTIDKEYQDLPIRVRNNIKRDSVKIDIISWDSIFKSGEEYGVELIKQLIDKAFDQRQYNDYDISDLLQRHHK